MTYLLDDFSRPDGPSLFGTEWIAFTDQVMGGTSQQQITREVYEGVSCLHLRGQVSLENNGGFIQAALPLIQSRYLFDARHFQGVHIVARSPQREGYFLHLRTKELSMPWQHYRAAFFPERDWTPLQIPFAAFYPVSTGHELNLERLTRLGIVAAGRAFEANIHISEVGFY